MMELTLKKIFEELIIRKSKIEYKSGEKKLVVKYKYRHKYKIGCGIWDFIKLVK